MCNPWGCKELDMTYGLNNNNIEERMQGTVLSFRFLIHLPTFLAEYCSIVECVLFQPEPLLQCKQYK